MLPTSDAFETAKQHFLNGLKALQSGAFEQAKTEFEQSLVHMPDRVSTLINLNATLLRLNQVDASLALSEKILKLEPTSHETLLNLGEAHLKRNDMVAAVAAFEQALALTPDYAEARWNMSQVCLLQGEFDRGWDFYESRWELADHAPLKRTFQQPLWLGQAPLKGRTLLLHAEQGLGDTLQFCRYAPMAQALGARVVLEAPPALLPLLSTLDGVEALVPHGENLPAFDFHCPLLSLPLAFQTRLGTVPARPRYLQSAPERTHIWTTALGPRQRPRVGLVWSGNPEHRNDRQRSIALSKLASALPPGVDYYGLQKHLRASDEAALDAHPEIQFLGPQIRDFADTAALCELMDVVISVDTSVAHLSAALGCPTWVLLPFTPDWRWLMERKDSPWYPTMRLYRQSQTRSWDEVLHHVATDLQPIVLQQSPAQ